MREIKANIGIMEGVKAAIGFEIGLIILSAIKTILRGIRFALAVYVMYVVGEWIQADQAANKQRVNNAVVHSINK